jgi:mRNA interferase RelE/StbE
LVWRIEVTATAAKQLGKLDKGVAKGMTGFLRQCLSTLNDPRVMGKALTGPQLGTYWRYRVGDYCIICDLQNDALCVLMIEIGHRREIHQRSD